MYEKMKGEWKENKHKISIRIKTHFYKQCGDRDLAKALAYLAQLFHDSNRRNPSFLVKDKPINLWSVLFARLCLYKGGLNAQKPT